MSGRIDVGAALGSMLTAASAASLFGVVVAVLLAGVGPFPAFGQMPSVWHSGLLLVALTCGHTFLLRLLTATRRFRPYLVVTLVQGVTNMVLLIVLVGLLKLGTAAAVTAFAVSYAVGTALSFWFLRGAKRRMSVVGKDQLPSLFSYAAKYYPALLGHAIDFNAGTLVLATMTGSGEVGLYAAIAALMLRLLLLAQALQETVLPRIAADPKGRPELVARMSRIAVAATAVMTVVFCVVSKPVLALLLSPAFTEAASLAWWIAPGLILHAASTVLMPYFEGTNRPGIVSIATWAGLLTNVGSIIFIYPVLGLQGAALALSMGMTVRFLILATLFCNSTGASWQSIAVIRSVDARLFLGVIRPWLKPMLRGK
jgi:O-antigen/teichoic acid export membrane protein